MENDNSGIVPFNDLAESDIDLNAAVELDPTDWTAVYHS
jgi:hypothetical protein